MAIQPITFPEAQALATAAIAQALASMTNGNEDRRDWNKALREYLHRRTLYDAEDAFGAYRYIVNEYDQVRADLRKHYGSDGFQKDERFQEVWKKLGDVEEANTDNYMVPMWEAVRVLVQTPAPDMPAIMLKVEIIKREEAWNDAGIARDAMEIVHEDMARIVEAA